MHFVQLCAKKSVTKKRIVLKAIRFFIAETRLEKLFH